MDKKQNTFEVFEFPLFCRTVKTYIFSHLVGRHTTLCVRGLIYVCMKRREYMRVRGLIYVCMKRREYMRVTRLAT